MRPPPRRDRSGRRARTLLPHARPGPNEAVDREIAHHLEERVRRLVEAGMEPGEARREAERRFGDDDAVRKEVRSVDRSAIPGRTLAALVEEIGRDVRLAVRAALRARWFTAAVVAITICAA